MPIVKIEATLDNLNEVSSQVVDVMSATPIVLFYGEMGSGKTTLIKNICKLLQVNEEVSSPTFSLVNEYTSKQNETIYHFDFYRIETESEAFDMGYEEYFYSGNICLVEWPEKIHSLIPEKVIEVNIQIKGNKRSYKINY